MGEVEIRWEQPGWNSLAPGDEVRLTHERGDVLMVDVVRIDPRSKQLLLVPRSQLLHPQELQEWLTEGWSLERKISIEILQERIRRVENHVASEAAFGSYSEQRGAILGLLAGEVLG